MEVPVADGNTAISSLKMKLYLAMVSGSTTPIQFFQFVQNERRLARKLGLVNNYGAQLGHVGSLMKPGEAENAFNKAQTDYDQWCIASTTAPDARTRFDYTMNEISKLVFGPSWADAYRAEHHYLGTCFQMNGRTVPLEEVRDLRELNGFLPFFPYNMEEDGANCPTAITDPGHQCCMLVKTRNMVVVDIGLTWKYLNVKKVTGR